LFGVQGELYLRLKQFDMAALHIRYDRSLCDQRQQQQQQQQKQQQQQQQQQAVAADLQVLLLKLKLFTGEFDPKEGFNC